MSKNKINPLISVIISYYKKRLFLQKTLNSIKKQSYKNYEVIFVFDDDNKMDVSFVKKSLSIFKKKKLIVNKKNLGVAKSRNIAIKNSRGSYLAFIDADDVWKKNKLSKQLNFMKANSLLFSFTSYSEINQKNNFLKKNKVKRDADYNSLYRSNFIGLSTVMICKKKNLKIFFPHLKTQEDLALWLRLARNGVLLKHFKPNLSYWRRTNKSLSSNTLRKLKDLFLLYNHYEKKNFIISLISVLILSYNKILKNFK